MAESCQNRTFADEVDLAEAYGGEDGFFKLLGVNSELGISSDEIERRKELFGTNEKPVIELSNYCELLW